MENFLQMKRSVPNLIFLIILRRNVRYVYFVKLREEMPGIIIGMQKNLANCSELLEIVRSIFVSCLTELRYVYTFQNTINWKIYKTEWIFFNLYLMKIFSRPSRLFSSYLRKFQYAYILQITLLENKLINDERKEFVKQKIKQKIIQKKKHPSIHRKWRIYVRKYL